MTPEQEASLTSGGETTLHSHPFTVNHDLLMRLNELEKVVQVSADYTVQADDDILLLTAFSAFTITLPFTKGGKRVIIILIAGNKNVTVQPQSGETINGASSVTVGTLYSPLRLKAIKGVGYVEV